MLFSVTVDAACPPGTVYAQFTITGPDIPLPDSFVAAGGENAESVNGLITRTNVAFANLKTIYPGSFFISGTATYTISYDCWNYEAERTTAQYSATIDYTSNGPGALGAWAVTSEPGPAPVLPTASGEGGPLDGLAAEGGAQPSEAAASAAASGVPQSEPAGADVAGSPQVSDRTAIVSAPTDSASIAVWILIGGALIAIIAYVVRTIRANRAAAATPPPASGLADRARDRVP